MKITTPCGCSVKQENIQALTLLTISIQPSAKEIIKAFEKQHIGMPIIQHSIDSDSPTRQT